ncbi:hypothetical protein PRIPAC_84316 [Pristionchus pacificus]|uniref:BED-type domain-containing protein n=1 Tax=Pristionchus pacificus TaxID=54126 RepID=A0A2A6BTF7_PRIPA|nr:hypothetical protein PRIPAC_84316 [Pristionchus pacificus]|eukprot:PDM69180.1 hypothetical protein PRIPAC_47482 [Pristionchus pacificus]
MSQPLENDQRIGCPPQFAKYFVLDQANKVYRCRLCKESQSRKGKIAETSSVSNYYRHLRDCHPEECLSQEQRNEKFGELCVTAFATNLIPFNVMDSKEFQEMIRFLDYDIKLPSRRTISSKPRNVKKISVKPLHSLDEYSSQSEAEIDSEDEGVMMEAMKQSMEEARKKQKEMEEENEAEQASVITSRSKRGRSVSKKSNPKKTKK